MQPIERVDAEPKQYASVEYTQAVQTALGMLYLIFTKSIQDLQRVEVALRTKRFVKPIEEDLVHLLFLFEAKIVIGCWDRYIECLAKEAELSKAADKKYHQRKEEIEKQEILRQESVIYR